MCSKAGARMTYIIAFIALAVPFGFAGWYVDRLFAQRHIRRRLNEIHEDQANQSRLWNTANEP